MNAARARGAGARGTREHPAACTRPSRVAPPRWTRPRPTNVAPSSGPHGRVATVAAAASSSSASNSSTPPPAPPPPGPISARVFAAVDALEAGTQAGGAGGRTTLAAFQAADQAWLRLRTQPEGAAAGPAPQFVRRSSQPLPSPPEYDVVVCGGTLGVFAAAALAARGLRVAVVERGPLRGRAQEWNLSRKELLELAHVGVATQEELEQCVGIEFNPVRVGFAWKQPGAPPSSTAPASASPPSSASTSAASSSTLTEVWTRDVLNLGVKPDALLQLMRGKLEAAAAAGGWGGAVRERTALEGITVHPNGAALELRPDGAAAAAATLTARLVVDCMGHFSPVVRQVRWGAKPDGVCLVVGALGSGFPHNATADVILTNTPLQPDAAPFNRAQYFWEAFPASSGPIDRTSYMFTYLDASPERPSLSAMLEDYWRLMPPYQGVDLQDITIKRILFGYFPTFKDSPLRPAFDRIIQIGDASGIQSPLSFGGFGALTRHLGRLTRALGEALDADALDAAALGAVHSYSPGLSASWMMQRAMSVRAGDRPAPQLINRMLAGNFRAMERLGDPVMKPFLQDVIQFGPMMQTMAAQMLTDPASVPGLIAHVGPGPLAEWLGHMGALGAYAGLHAAASAARLRAAVARASGLSPRQRYELGRLLDAWEYGSGSDYKL